MSIIAKYKFDKSIYENLIPEFNEGYTGYTISDEIDSENSNHVIRTISHDNTKPTLMRFGQVWQEGAVLGGARYESLLEIISLDTSALTNMHSMFRSCFNVYRINTDGWNTDNVTDMRQTFTRCYSLTSIDVSNIHVTGTLYAYFSQCINLNEIIGLDTWDTSEVTDMTHMFHNCTALTSLDLSNWDTSNVKDMFYMFSYCNNLASIGDVSKWDTSKVTRMEQMFFNCQKLTSIDMSNWNTGNVTNMYQMFHNCHAIKSVGNIRNFVTNKVTTIKGMFENCYALKDIDTSNWDVSNVDTMECVFEDCGGTILDLSNWNIKNTCVTIAMLSGCSARTIYMYDSDYASVNRIIEQLPQVDNAELYIGGIDSLGSVNLSGARAKNWSVINKYKVAKYKFDKSIYENLIPEFNEGYTGYTISDEIDSENSNHVIRTILGNSLPTKIRFGTIDDGSGENNGTSSSNSLLEVDYINASNCVSLEELFRACSYLTRISSIVVSNTTNSFRNMFSWCYALTSLDVSKWDTSNVTDMFGMFYYCKSLTSLDVSNWDTSNVINLCTTFRNCQSLTSLDVSNFDTSNVTNMNGMFNGCHNLTSLDVSNFDTSNVTRMDYMFYNCNKLTSLDVSNFDTGNVESMAYMFDGCYKLTSLDVSNFDTKNLHYTTCMFYNCFSLTNVDVSRWNTRNLATIFRMFHGCENMEKVDLSTWDLATVKPSGSTIHAYRMFGGMKKLKELIVPKSSKHKFSYIHDLIAGCLELEYLDLNGLNINSVAENMPDIIDPGMRFDIVAIIDDQATANASVPKLKRIKIDDNELLKELLRINQIPDRVGTEAGQIVTAIRDQIDEEIIDALTAKNWIVKDLVAQYVYDANTYENLLPEFNTEFTSDKYEIHDNVNEIVIDGFKWENGSIHNGTGNDVLESEDTNENQFFINYRKSDFVPVIGNAELISNYRINSIIYYDESKKYIGYNSNTTTTDIILPINTKYIRLTVHAYNTPDYDNLTLTAKLVTRSIESKNGDLPTLMRFGHNGDSMDDHVAYTGPATALLKVLAANTNELTTGDRMFRYCKRVEEIRCSNWNTSNMIDDMGSMFATASDYLTELDVSNFDVSNVKSISTMFWGCFKLTSLDVSKWDTRNVTDMYGVFNAAYNLNNIIGIEDWDTSNVKVMNYMFSYCYNLQSLDLSKWNVDNVINMERMFNDCASLGLLNLSSWNMNRVENVNNMIYGCNKLNSIIMYNSNAVSINKIINQLPTRTEANKGALVIAGVDDRTLVNATVAESKFWIVKSRLVAKYKFNKSIYDNFLPDMGTDFTSYTIIDEVSPYNANHITRMIVSDSAPQIMKFGADGNDYSKPKALMEVIHVHMDNLRWCYNMFRGCQYATAINMKNVNTDLMTNMSCMFSMCYNITTLDVSSFNTSQITDMQFVFDDCNKLAEIKGLENWDVSNVTSFHSMFENCRALTSLSNIYDWNVGKVTNMMLMFQNCYNLTSLDLNNWNTINVTRMDNMFCHCYNLTTLDASNWNTINVTRMDHMFENCQVLTSLDVSNWNTINVFTMYYMFNNCKSLSSLDVSKFNTSNVASMGCMFKDCESLTSLDVSNWVTSKVTDMSNMFRNCEKLTSLDVSNWDTSKVTDMNTMFCYCATLTSLDVSNWDTSNVTNMRSVFEACCQLVNLDVSRWNTSKVTNMRSLFANCYKLTSIDVSNFDTSNVTDMGSMFDDIGDTNNTNGLSVLNLSNFDFSKVTNAEWLLNGSDAQLKIKELNLNNLDLSTISNINNFMDSDYSNGVKNPRIISNNLNTINLLVDMLPNRSTLTTSGQIVTTLRDQIDEETMATLTAKNWIVKDSVAQYVYDANTYEDLMPEFNPEFTEDMYEVHDSVSEIVIDDIQWEPGGISETAGTDHNGVNEEYPDRVRSGYLTVIPNTEYKFNVPYVHVFWYNENKQFISYDGMYGTNGGNSMGGDSCVAPTNAKYLRIARGAGPYTMSITAKIVTRSIESVNGDLPTLMRFGNSNWDGRENREKSLLKVIDLNGKELTKTTVMFNNCHRLVELNTTNLITNKVTNTSLMFHECRELKIIDSSDYDMSNVTNIWGMFQGCSKLTSLDVSKWDTSNMDTIGVAFSACYNLTTLDVSNWDVSKVNNLISLFHGCQSLTSLDVSRWDTSNVTSMEFMFAGCYSLTSLDVSNFNTSKVKNMNEMFYNCNNLTSLDVSKWDTSNVESMRWLFYKCYLLTSLDVSNFNTSKVTAMNAMFYYCHELTSIGDVSKWDTSKVDTMSYMFEQCYKLLNIPGIENWDTTNVTTTNAMFWDCHSLTSLDLSNFDTRNVTDMGRMFRECHLLTSLDLSGFDTSNVTNMEAMFYNCNNLTSLDVSNWDTGEVTNMSQMFGNCKSLTSLDVSKWDVSKVTGMDNMFYNCQSLTSLDVLEWDTSSLRDITSLFYACSNLKSLDVSHWNVDKCGSILGDNTYSMRNVFNDTGLRVLNLSKWSKIEWLYDILEDGRICNNFINSTVLKTIDFGNCIIPYYPVNWLKAPNLRYIKCDNGTSVSNLIEQVPTRTEAEPGYIITTAEISDDHKGLFNAKYWNIVKLDEVGTDIAIYKFNKSVYKSLVPVFDNNFADWFMDDVVEDEVNAPNIVTRTIRSMGGLPTKMIFGVSSSLGAYEDRSLSLLEVHKLNTSNITTMGQMFKRCTGVTMINTADWDVSNVTNMNELFFECAKITSLDVSNWDTRNVNNMSSIFIHCFKLQNIIGLNNWDTSNAQTMQWMFQDCQSLKSIDVSNWDTSKVNNMGSMFRYAISLESLDLSSFDTRAVTSMNCMFAGIDYGNYNPMSLTSITFGENWDTGNVTNMSSMFRNCQKLTSLDVSNFNISNVTNIDYMFYNCRSLTSLDASNWDTGNVTTMFATFAKCSNISTLDVSNWDTGNVTAIGSLFDQCYSLTSIDVSKWNTSKVKYIDNTFNGCNSLTSLDVSNWDTSRVIQLNGSFFKCKKIKNIDVSNWDTRNVTNCVSTFAECESLIDLDLSNFNTGKLKNMNEMFRSCLSLVSLDISNFKLNDSTTYMDAFSDNTTIENIGMIYCDFKTVEKIASLVPITNPTTIWIGNHIDINGLPQYDHITYKVYEVEDNLEVELSSPLLEGDRLEIIDGDLYHYHKMNMFTVDKNDHDRWAKWTTNSTDQGELDEVGHAFYIHNKVANELGAIQFSDGYCSAMIFDGRQSNIHNHTQAFDHVRMSCWLPAEGTPNHRLYCFTNEKYDDINDFKQYIYKLYPFNVTYILDKPYYELVKPNVGLLNAEQGLYLNISDSVVPVVNHQDLCTLKLNYLLPNVEYKVKFKANSSGSIAINLGGTLVPLDVVEGWNEVMVTTPETLVDEYLKVNGSEGIKIQNVMVIDSNKDFDYFKGMNNTFDEIPVKNICTNRTLTYTHGVDEEGVSPQGEMNVNVNKGKVVTVVGKVSNNPDNLPISINLYNNSPYLNPYGKNLFPFKTINTNVKEVNSSYFKNNVFLSAGTYMITSDVYDNLTKDISPILVLHTLHSLGFNYQVDLEGRLLHLPCDATGFSLYSNHYDYIGSVGNYVDFSNIQIEEGEVATAYEPPEFNVNANPIFINPDENGYFAITIRADRDYANRIGFNVGDAFACEENDQVTITDLMVFEGDILDCQPTTYVDPADTRYLVEYKSIGNPFGFGKNKLI